MVWREWGLVNRYTVCRETRSTTLQQTVLSSREGETGRNDKRERGSVMIPSFCLVISGKHTDMEGTKSTHGKDAQWD